ncbi:MAG: DUF2059 domain-containing protein [Paracoccaceae bacterium]
MRQLRHFLWIPIVIAVLSVQSVWAATDRTRVESFLQTTGFDVALESIKLSAGSAPAMLGVPEDAFGIQWTFLTKRVFDKDVMHGLALDILQQTLTDDLLDHANAFYASDLGQRLVAAENAAHMTPDDDAKTQAGEAIVAGLVRIGSTRVADLTRMTTAVDSDGTAVRAIHEIQVRFLMAAAGAGVIELQLDEPDLREMLKSQENTLRQSIRASALSGSAYTYQAFSDAEVAAYADALEDPKMKRVYALMNAVQYEIMANRFEALAVEMAGLQPSTDL